MEYVDDDLGMLIDTPQYLKVLTNIPGELLAYIKWENGIVDILYTSNDFKEMLETFINNGIEIWNFDDNSHFNMNVSSYKFLDELANYIRRYGFVIIRS